MGRKASQFTVVTKKTDPAFVKMFSKTQDALDFTGPEYDKKGFVVTTFEKKTETYFEVIEPEEEDGTSGQDRKNYSDNQDRESYNVK